MARVHGKNANYSFNGTAIESDLDEVTMNWTVPSAEVTAFSDAYGNVVAGKINTKTEISGTYDPAASKVDTVLFAALQGGVVTTNFDPVGGGPDTGNPEYVCTASGLTGVLIDSIDLEFPVDGSSKISASLQHSGSTARNVS